MEKHFVDEQPAYTDLMRSHNPVDYIFLAALYALLGGVLIYTILELKAKGDEAPAAEEAKEEEGKLQFVEVFVQQGNKNFDKLFHEYY